MKVLGMIVCLLMCISIGIGQTRTIKQQQAINKTAVWEKIGENDAGGKAYMEISDITKVATLAMFNTKYERNGVILYATIAVNCMEDTFMSVNVFASSGESAMLVRMKEYDSKEPASFEKGTIISDMSLYACKFGKEK